MSTSANANTALVAPTISKKPSPTESLKDRVKARKRPPTLANPVTPPPPAKKLKIPRYHPRPTVSKPPTTKVFPPPLIQLIPGHQALRPAAETWPLIVSFLWPHLRFPDLLRLGLVNHLSYWGSDPGYEQQVNELGMLRSKRAINLLFGQEQLMYLELPRPAFVVMLKTMRIMPFRCFSVLPKLDLIAPCKVILGNLLGTGRFSWRGAWFSLKFVEAINLLEKELAFIRYLLRDHALGGTAWQDEGNHLAISCKNICSLTQRTEEACTLLGLDVDIKDQTGITACIGALLELLKELKP